MTCPSCGSDECEHVVDMAKVAMMASDLLKVCDEHDASIGEATTAMLIAFRAQVDAIYTVFDNDAIAVATINGCKLLAEAGGVSVELPAVEEIKKERRKAERKRKRREEKKRKKLPKCPHCGRRAASADSNLCGDALMGRDCASLN